MVVVELAGVLTRSTPPLVVGHTTTQDVRVLAQARENASSCRAVWDEILDSPRLPL